jgi:hypothetical protein
VGGPRLDQVATRTIGDPMEHRFRAMAEATFSRLVEGSVVRTDPAVSCIDTGHRWAPAKVPHL